MERINGKDSLVKNSDRYLQVQSGYSQYDITQKFAYRQNDHLVHGLNIQYSNSSNVPCHDRLTDPGGSGLRYANGITVRKPDCWEHTTCSSTMLLQNSRMCTLVWICRTSKKVVTPAVSTTIIYNTEWKSKCNRFNADFKEPRTNTLCVLVWMRNTTRSSQQRRKRI